MRCFSCLVAPSSVEAKDRIFVKDFGLLSFAKKNG